MTYKFNTTNIWKNTVKKKGESLKKLVKLNKKTFCYKINKQLYKIFNKK